jgi:hypothetical protein
MISNWSKIGYLASLVFIIISIYRYWFEIKDIDRFIAYVTIGILIFAVSWLYNKQLNQGNTISAMEEHLANGRKF